MTINALKVKLRKLHKYIGFTFSIFILYLTITGMLLLYPETFKIEDASINNYFILKKYNMETHKSVFVEHKSNKEIVLIKNSLYFENKYIDKYDKRLLGAIFLEEYRSLFVINENFINIYLFELEDDEYEIIDIITIENENNLIDIGLEETSLDIIGRSENSYYRIKNNEIYKTSEIESTNILYWSEFVKAKKTLALKYLTLYQGNGVSVIRILTELHNGRFFGSIYTFILFISSLSLIFLTLSSFVFATNITKIFKK